MCGIVGIIHNNQENYSEVVKTMNLVQSHRGPDGSGVVSVNNATLGHTRLSIVDITHGIQPMNCNQNDVTITFNGEIYGFLDIKEELNYKFQSNSDTEVILALYKEYGYELFDKLKGMFAFGMYDSRDDSLLLARDRFGEKPLYYTFGENGEFIFASEIKAILATNLVKPKVSKEALKGYLNYLYINPNETIYENIYTLKPATYLVYKNNEIEVKEYYKYPKTEDISIEDAIEVFKIKFEKSVSNQLIADVEVGAFLSGGLDSSSVVAVAKKYKPNLKTFSFGFEGAKSELSYAKEIADKYNTDHYELYAKDVDIADMLLEMTNVYDEPFGDSSNIPTYLISKLAREHLKVILTGDGADELLGGYGWWYNPLLGVKEKSSFIKEMMFKVLAKSIDRRFSQKSQQLKYARKYDTIIQAHEDRAKYFNDIEVNKLLRREYTDEYFYQFEEENNINDALKMDLHEYMAGDILVKTDRASMANSLELRAPFLDVDFASFCISLPSALKITEYEDKLILRRAYQDTWSENIRKRGKQGFGSPVSKWLKKESVQEIKKEYFKMDKKMFEYIDYNTAKGYFMKDNYQTWALLTLSIWFEKYKEYM